jgi:hypothetical protein
MKSTVAAAATLAFALAATTASAGVVISQKVVITDQLGEHKSEQTMLVQGTKRKVISGESEILTDLDAGKVYFIRPKDKQYVEVGFPPTGMFARMMARQGISVGFTKGDATHKVAGYTCQEYAGAAPVGINTLNMTECVASDAPGAKEFAEFQKAMAEKLKGTGLAPNGDVPDGVPVSSTSTFTAPPFTPPKGMAPEQAKQMEELMAKRKPTVTNTTVSKIEAKDLPADTFILPANYTRREVQFSPTSIPGKLKALHAHVPGELVAPPVSPGGAPAAPASPAPQ